MSGKEIDDGIEIRCPVCCHEVLIPKGSKISVCRGVEHDILPVDIAPFSPSQAFIDDLVKAPDFVAYDEMIETIFHVKL